MKSLVIAAVMTAGLAAPCLADLAPRAVWQAWEAGSTDAKAALERSEGDTLVLEGVSLRLGAARVLIDRIALVPAGQTVRVEASNVARVVPPEGGEGRLSAPGAVLTVSGAPDRLSYDLAARELSLALGELAGADDLSRIEASFTDLTARLEGVDAGMALDLAAEAGGLDLSGMDGNGTEIAVGQDWTLPRLSYDGAIIPPDGRAVGAGGRASLRFETSGNVARLAADGPEGRVTAGLDSAATRLDVLRDDGRVDLSRRAKETRLSLDLPSLPEGIAAEINDLSLDLEGPAVPTGASEDVSLDLSLLGVTVDDAVWERFDPGADLPREPAELRVEIDGRARLGEGAAAAHGMPLAVESADIAGIALQALGARLDLEGALEWADTSPDGLLRPEGRIGLRLDGAEPFIGDLVAAGILGEAQALFAQFALTRFTHDTDAEGVRESEIEVGPDGAIVIDGAALR